MEAVKLFIRAGMRPIIHGDSALWAAIAAKNAEIAKILIDAGADVERDRKELLEYAMEKKDQEIEKMIREAPASPK